MFNAFFSPRISSFLIDTFNFSFSSALSAQTTQESYVSLQFKITSLNLPLGMGETV